MPRKYDDANRPLCCWVTPTELEQFRAVARANHVTPTAYLRALVVDALAEESPKLPVQRRRLRLDVFAILRKGEGEVTSEDLQAS